MRKPHILAIPFPLQSHVIALMELSQCFIKHGFKVTFVNTEYNHKRVLDSLADKDAIGGQIHLVSISDGMEPWEDRNDLGKLCNSIRQAMPPNLEELINRINMSEEEGMVTCVVADFNFGWALKVAEKMKVRGAAFSPVSAATILFCFKIRSLIDDGIFDSDGTLLKKNQEIQLGASVPAISPAHFLGTVGDAITQKVVFSDMVRNSEVHRLTEWILCNSTCDLEPAASSMIPQLLPIGPLLASNRLGDSGGYFWQQDSTSLEWLDQQQPNSVIYVAFGSITTFHHQTQFHELALGLELTNRPFLWVVRPDMMMTGEMADAYPAGFRERVATRGHLVSWANQQKVLSHPSIACFFSHCGWNSTLEGLANGIPFLCWPNGGDQFQNESYICDFWEVGLGLTKDNGGIITREEIKNKVEQIVSNRNFKSRALELKELLAKGVGEGGHSSNNFLKFITWAKE
ncbi:hypothetical protein Tsubulata_037958 [Turnera subulata]|uniref:Glycosyltransferase n=1 Tax=Turnera subulata TaxID=218843 RepID=A0A9Q0GGW9_9ROSI|nr:hypothetical protein Tsubulata_037958 [Turnera subulata]